MRKPVLTLALFALACNNGPNEPNCQNFFGSSSKANVTVAKIAGVCTVLHASRPNLAMIQTRCDFESNGSVADDPIIRGTVMSDGHVNLTYEANRIGCLVTGTGTIAGNTITATMSPPTPAPCGCVLTLVITKS